MIGFTLLYLFCANFRFGVAVELNQRNATWADIGTGTTFDTVEEVMILRFLKLIPFRKPVELLW